MSEETNQPIDSTAEVETLRRVNGELKTKSASRKARVAELEASVAELQSKLSEAQNALRQTIIEAPLKAMASEISSAPELWLQEFGKTYRLESVNGKPTLQTVDGKPVDVPFERDALVKLLTIGDDATARGFKSITVASRASGAGGGSGSQRSKTTSKAEAAKPQFGLR
jgi:hypothetical protein